MTAEASVLERPLFKLDLGAGSRPKEGFVGVDRVAMPGGIELDLTSGDRWPFDDGSVDELRSSHFIEHIQAAEVDTYTGRRQDALFFFFEEAYRIARPGARFEVVWPALKSSGAFQDPTHRRFISPRMFTYLSKSGRESLGVTHYDVRCDWHLDLSQAQTFLYSQDPITHESWESLVNGGWEMYWDVAYEHRLVIFKPETEKE